MDNDFGLLVDYLRGELDERALAAVRSRLEAEGPLFDAFVRLRRTFAVLRSMPTLSGAGAPARAAYLADLQREFETRGWAEMLPALQPSPAFVAMLRTEFAVRALMSCLPQLVPGPSFIAALRARFGVQAVVSSLPAIVARAQWIGALRHEFVVRATLETVPQLEPTAAYHRRVQLAVFEAARESEPEPVAPLLPTLAASESFRRRLSRSIRQAAVRRPRVRPSPIDARENRLGRALAGTWKRVRRPLATTMTVHVLAIAALFFITAGAWRTEALSFTAMIDGSAVLRPEQPGDTASAAFHLPTADGEAPRESINARPPVDEMFAKFDGTDLVPAPAGDELPLMPREATTFVEEPARTATLAWFRLRPEGRHEKIRYLGSSELYEALERSLQWLNKAQRPEGYWGIEDATPPMNPAARTIQQVELTSAALLAFLGDGHSSRQSLPGLDYNLNVRRGIDWLLRQQQADGRIGPADEPIVLAHAMATLALAEEFTLTRDWRIGAALRNACRWLSEVRPVSGGGGFPYRAAQEASLMTSVWAHMALSTAIRAGVPAADAPPERIESLLSWFATQTRYETPLTDATSEVLADSELLPTAGAAALACLQAEPEGKAKLDGWLARVAKDAPDIDGRHGDASDMRYLFLGSLAFANTDAGTAGQRWQAAMSATLLAGQVKEGRHEGAFEPTSRYADVYGRVFSTALAALSIENAWRVRVK